MGVFILSENMSRGYFTLNKLSKNSNTDWRVCPPIHTVRSTDTVNNATVTIITAASFSFLIFRMVISPIQKFIMISIAVTAIFIISIIVLPPKILFYFYHIYNIQFHITNINKKKNLRRGYKNLTINDNAIDVKKVIIKIFSIVFNFI